MGKLKKVLNLLKIFTFLLLEAPFRPRWAYYRLRAYVFHYILDSLHRKRVHEYRQRMKPLTEALSFITGKSIEAINAIGQSELVKNIEVKGKYVVSLDQGKEALESCGNAKGPIEVHYGPSPEWMTITNTVCRVQRPQIVVETGVAKGFTSAAILDALKSNGSGKLYSVELPSLYIGYKDQVGEAIPNRLKENWLLELGPSAIVLPDLLKRVGPVDLFLHDSASNYDNQSMEYRVAIKNLSAGGILISNMIQNDAFIEVAESINCRWSIIKQTKDSPIGILIKL